MRQKLPRSWKPFAALALSAALFVPLMLFGGSAFAKTGSAAWEYQYSPSSSQYQYGGGTICHHTHSWKHPFVQITIGAPGVLAHLRHGDTLGPCPAPPSIGPIGRHHDDDGDADDQVTTTPITTTPVTTTPVTTTTSTVTPFSGFSQGGGDGDHGHHGHGH